MSFVYLINSEFISESLYNYFVFFLCVGSLFLVWLFLTEYENFDILTNEKERRQDQCDHISNFSSLVLEDYAIGYNLYHFDIAYLEETCSQTMKV